ncbi:hypothetical protein HPT25_20215 [Bacillus sp. BRMEA1]|uniref:hypothetical protein n=1 Tax=Neobacillus endophyticus TaxID=2738405 RepID=UPI001567B87E|nr:hypothetical protein [Neobacillus endophyticus]NRD79690.1 hypothetical protein [Neobacillus endophyticus]
MFWTLAGLFVISLVLLIFSIMKTSQAAKKEHEQIDMMHISTMKEINALQDSVRNLELDLEVVIEASGFQLSSEERIFMREVLDLYKRSYSIENIAELKQVPVSEIEQIVAPYQQVKDGGRKVAVEN